MKNNKEDLAGEFKSVSHGADTGFHIFLNARFDDKVCADVKKVFQNLQLPFPQEKGEFMEGTGGGLIFLDRYGLVIRIETFSQDSDINDNPWVLQPLFQHDCGPYGKGPRRVILKICPGCKPATHGSYVAEVDKNLAESDIHYADRQIANTGHIPYFTPKFPEGFPVVIDLPSVWRLNSAVADIKDAVHKNLQKLGIDQDPQQQIYGDLKNAMREAWPEGTEKPDPGKIRDFWKLCESAVAKGILMAGWNTDNKELKSGDYHKRGRAALAAAQYGKKLQITV